MAARLAPALKLLLERPEPDRRLGPFVLVSQLGRGGFAPVWLAKEVYGTTELRTAAVKLFSLEREGGETSLGGRSSSSREQASSQHREQVIQEARALCQVEHPNIVRFYSLLVDDVGSLIGLAMEYVGGVALDKRLEAAGKLEVPEALAIGIAVASALSAVHRAGLVHRDVKPANVIDSGGLYKLIDFGIAAADAPKTRAARADAPRVVLDDLPLEVVGTRMSTLAGSSSSAIASSGTVGYIDPVCVASGAPATVASDLYALGAMLFECLTGRLPAVAATGAGGGMKGEVLDGRSAAPALAEVAPGAPPALARVIDALLAPERAERPSSAEAVVHELERVRGEVLGRKHELPPESVGPFRGLGRFELADRDVYFGRAIEVASALEVLRSRGVVALVGPSGSGKSSLARAGVLPAVCDGALGAWPPEWDAVVVTPGADPKSAILAALGPFLPRAADLPRESIVPALAERAQRDRRGLVLLVDQLEELCTVSEEASRAWTAAFLAHLGDQALPGVRGVFAARRDLLDPLLALGDLGRVLVRSSLLVSPMSDASWDTVLDQALEAYDYRFENQAVRDELVKQLRGTAGAMPLVQFALTQLWNQRDTKAKRITRAGLVAIGGVAGALERHAEATLSQLGPSKPGSVMVARRVLTALTTPQGTRAARPAEELERIGGDDARAVLDALEAARLVVREPEGLTLAHEALLTQWGRLRSWVAEAREDRLLAAEIERDAGTWESEADATLLWKKRRLVAAVDLERRGSVELSSRALGFVRAGRSAERRFRVAAAAVVALALGAAAFGGNSYVNEIEAASRNETALREKAESERTYALGQKQEAERAQQLAIAAQRKAEQAEGRVKEQAERHKQDYETLELKLSKAKSAAQLQEIADQVRKKRGGASEGASGPALAPSPTSTAIMTVGAPP